MNKLESYKLLGLSDNASNDDIKKAYRAFTSKYHPDRHQDKSPDEIKGFESKFKDIKQAYEILTGKIKPSDEFNGHNSDSAFHSAFSEIMRRRREQSMNGDDVQYEVEIPILLAVNGGSHDVEVRHLSACISCDGRGAIIKQEENKSFHSEYCTTCNGSGKIVKSNKYTVFIPKNTSCGAMLRLKGKGKKRNAPSGKDGDLYIVISILSDGYFYSNGKYLMIDVVVDPITWLIGGPLTIGTPHGIVEIKILPMYPNGGTMRVPGKGIGIDDLWVKLSIDGVKISDSNLISCLDTVRQGILSDTDSSSSIFKERSIIEANKLTEVSS